MPQKERKRFSLWGLFDRQANPSTGGRLDNSALFDDYTDEDFEEECDVDISDKEPHPEPSDIQYVYVQLLENATGTEWFIEYEDHPNIKEFYFVCDAFEDDDHAAHIVAEKLNLEIYPKRYDQDINFRYGRGFDSYSDGSIRIYQTVLDRLECAEGAFAPNALAYLFDENVLRQKLLRQKLGMHFNTSELRFPDVEKEKLDEESFDEEIFEGDGLKNGDTDAHDLNKRADASKGTENKSSVDDSNRETVTTDRPVDYGETYLMLRASQPPIP